MKIIEKPDLFDTRKNFATWIYAIASNMCKNEYRRISVRNINNSNIDINQAVDNVQSEFNYIDKQNAAAYHETDQEQNVRLYEKFGYKVVETEPIFSVTNWFLWRPPKKKIISLPTKNLKSS